MPILIFIAAFLVRVLVQYYMGSFVAPETCEYEDAANNFLSGRGLVYDIYGTTYYSLLTPFYPLLCAFIYFLTNHSFFAMAIVQAIISSLICVIIFFIGKYIFGNKVGLLAAILTIFHPGLLIYTSKFHSFVLDTFLFCLIILLLIITKRSPNLLNQLKLGISFGLAMLTRSTILLFLPFSWFWLKKGSKKLFFVYVFTSLLVLSPWIIRNYVIHKKVLILSSSANVFWRGNNSLATGTSHTGSGKTVFEEANILSLIYGKSEMEQNKIFKNESYKFIRNNPKKFIELTSKKFFYFWWFAPTTGILYKKEWLEIYRLFYSIILPFGFLGILALKNLEIPLKQEVHIIIIMMIVISFAQSLFYVETRHRWAIEPLLLIFTANGLIYTAEKGKLYLKTIKHA
jgi:4-amino-4-deoxy-L-arabinose transferase-like glycosyltransferase